MWCEKSMRIITSRDVVFDENAILFSSVEKHINNHFSSFAMFNNIIYIYIYIYHVLNFHVIFTYLLCFTKLLIHSQNQLDTLGVVLNI